MTVVDVLKPNDQNSDGESTYISDDNSDVSSISSDILNNSSRNSGGMNSANVESIRFKDERAMNVGDGSVVCDTWNDRSTLFIGPVGLLADRTAKDNNNVANSNNSPRNLVVAETRNQSAQTDNIYEALRNKRADDTVQALAVTIQYLAHEVRTTIFV